MALAEEAGEQADVDTLEACIHSIEQAPCVMDMDITVLEDLILTSLKYLKGDRELPGMGQMLRGITSPDMGWNDLKWFMNASSTERIFELEADLIQYMYDDFDLYDLGDSFDVPIYFIQGEMDYITPTPMVEDYYEGMNAPQKGMVAIAGTGHTPFLDQPEDFCTAVLDVLDE